MHRFGTTRQYLWTLALSLVVALVLAFVLTGAQIALGISRDSVLSRAQRRVDAPVPYSRTAYYAGYRTDCSGYVSMCWKTGTSWATRSFHNVTHPIDPSDLRPGDALLKKGYHIRLFYGWLDEAHTHYVAYESGYSTIAAVRIHSLADDLASGYQAVRYDDISSSPKPRNLLQNPTFDTWSRSWSDASEKPVWWDASSTAAEPRVTRRKDTYRTRKNSLTLYNPSTDPSTVAELTQSVPVKAGVDYRLRAYARTASNPAAVVLAVTYLDAYGEPINEFRRSGTYAKLNATEFRKMSKLTSAPPNAVRALVTVRLAGGTTTNTAGVAVRGTVVTIDDVYLARPQVTVGAKTSSTSARNGTRITLSGSVTPASAVGAPAIVYVKKPGSTTWTKLRTKTVYASGGAGAWKTTYTFKSSMKRGTYKFRTQVPAIPGYLGHTSKYVSVKLR